MQSKSKKKKNKLLLIGWDAADWQVIYPLMAKGLMPALKSVIDRGVYGNISTMNPPYSPMLWSSVATGKTPDKHGVLGFIEVVPGDKAIRPMTANSRKARALWNILHHEGYKSNVVGWWPSFPAEPINGVVVSDKFQKVGKDPSKPSPVVPGTIHPAKMAKELRDLRMFPWEMTKEHFLPLIPRAAEIDQTKENHGLVPFANVLSHNVSVHNAATYLIRETEWDFMAVYYDYIDHMCHSFMRFHPPKLPQIPQKNYDLFKDVINGAYRFQDMMLHRLLSLIDDDTTVIIMSDHGFESGDKRILKMPKVAAAPALDHRQFGIFVAAGPNIKKGEKLFGMSLIDVAPTILHHFGLPVGRDMDGKVNLDLFKETVNPEYIESWEKVEGNFGELDKTEQVDPFSDEESMQQLIELGYIERPDEKIETAIIKTKCDLKHNLARVFLGKKDYEMARLHLKELIEQDAPVNKARFYVDMMNACLGLKEFDEAAEYLQGYRKLDNEVNFNVYFIEADILLGQGKPHKALEVLAEAEKRSPNAEIYYRIGRVYHLNQNHEMARANFEQAIEMAQDRAKYHKALADALFELGEYEECAEHALTSIELVKYFPSAHYILGRALEKLGDMENARIALETANRLTPRTFHRAEKALENVIEKISAPLELSDKGGKTYRENQIVVVSGLPRSGTSLMMQMLAKGGIEPLTDEKRKADDSNPKGYFEFDPVLRIKRDNSWMHQAQNRSVKIVAPLLPHIDPKYRYKIIFMKRDLDEVLKSQRKMVGKDPDEIPVKLYNSYYQQLQFIDKWKDQEPGVELIYVDYADVLRDPDDTLKKIKYFTGVQLDLSKMKTCIDPNLYRNRIKETNS